MNLNTKSSIQQAYASTFADVSDAIDIKHETRMVMYRFLSEVERITDERNITRKELAKKIGTSPSFITQLFRGSKVMNLETVAKLEKALDIKFEIKANPEHEVGMNVDFDIDAFLKRQKDVNGYWVYVSLNRDYKNFSAEQIEIKAAKDPNCKLRVA